ncbi:ribonuclease H2 subunit C [Sitophilus oryzae]|uniref:Ribonuclease H2 subunit C n=1 Tax=Sitophilus oryzae TaxID=7048 RepID=A0A6J2XE91_SITOR|nr:ribonuclease H2 subunit C [Sitophilus oryzae]
MAIHIYSGKNHILHKLQNSRVQSIPFKILADCDTPVSKYFEPYIKSENEILKGSFRGYPLKGKKIDIPEGYVGLVVHESIRPTNEKDDRKFYVINKFNEFTYWNWDKIPSKNDNFLKAMDWIDIAEVLHSPITEE